jgi:hypothetical protein
MRLQAEGLFAVVAFEYHPGVDYSISWAIGGVRVQVIEAELEQALSIERACRAGEFRALLEAETGPPDLPVCPSCESNDYRTRRASSMILSLVATLVFRLPIPIRARVNICKDCGKRWVE